MEAVSSWSRFRAKEAYSVEYAIVVITPFPQPDDWARPIGAAELNSAQGANLSFLFVNSSNFQIIP